MMQSEYERLLDMQIRVWSDLAKQNPNSDFFQGGIKALEQLKESYQRALEVELEVMYRNQQEEEADKKGEMN